MCATRLSRSPLKAMWVSLNPVMQERSRTTSDLDRTGERTCYYRNGTAVSRFQRSSVRIWRLCVWRFAPSLGWGFALPLLCRIWKIVAGGPSRLGSEDVAVNGNGNQRGDIVLSFGLVGLIEMGNVGTWKEIKRMIYAYACPCLPREIDTRNK